MQTSATRHVLVQRQVSGTVELVAGVVHDARFGSLVMLGLGGVNTDLFADRALRLGRLAEELPEVAELDLNPVLAGPDGVVAVDVKLRLAPVADEPDPGVRELSRPTG